MKRRALLDLQCGSSCLDEPTGLASRPPRALTAMCIIEDEFPGHVWTKARSRISGGICICRSFTILSL